MADRPKPRFVTSPSEAGQLQYNEHAMALRQLDAGGHYPLEAPYFLGAIGTAKRCGKFASVRVANTAATGAFVAFGVDNTLAAPTGIADGLYIPPNSVVYLSAGENAWIRASAATVQGAVLKDSYVVATDDRISQV